MNNFITLHNICSGKTLLVNPESISRITSVRGLSDRETKVNFTDGEGITVSESFNMIKEEIKRRTK